MITKTNGPVTVHFDNQHSRYRLSGAGLLSLVTMVCRSLRYRRAVFSIVFVTHQAMRRYNLQAFSRRASTDVISFPWRAGQYDRGLAAYRGDVVICFDQVAANARRYTVPVAEECARCVVHGVLHLAGFTDTTAGEKREMVHRQEMLVKRFMAQGDLRRGLVRCL